MKRKIAFILTVLFSFFLLCSCKGGAIGKSKIKKDLEENFSFFTIDKIKIDKSQRVENNDTIWIEMEFHNEECKGRRYYKLYYSYYDRGGWMYEYLDPDRIGEWEAEPKKGIENSKENYANIIFEKSEKGDVTVRSDINAHFYKWASGTTPSDKPLERYVDLIEHTEELTEGHCHDSVTISTSTTKFSITETLGIDWYFDVEGLYWNFGSAYSEKYSAKLNTDLMGTYQNEYGKTATLSNFNEEEASFEFTTPSETEKYFLYGVNNAYTADPRGNGRELINYINFYANMFECRYNRHYSLDTKNTSETVSNLSKEESYDNDGYPIDSPKYKSLYPADKSYPVTNYVTIYKEDKTNALYHENFEGVKKKKNADGRYCFEFTAAADKYDRFSQFCGDCAGGRVEIMINGIKLSTADMPKKPTGNTFTLTFKNKVSEAEADTLFKCLVDEDFVYSLDCLHVAGVYNLAQSDRGKRLADTVIQ